MLKMTPWWQQRHVGWPSQFKKSYVPTYAHAVAWVIMVFLPGWVDAAPKPSPFLWAFGGTVGCLAHGRGAWEPGCAPSAACRAREAMS